MARKLWWEHNTQIINILYFYFFLCLAFLLLIQFFILRTANFFLIFPFLSYNNAKHTIVHLLDSLWCGHFRWQPPSSSLSFNVIHYVQIFCHTPLLVWMCWTTKCVGMFNTLPPSPLTLRLLHNCYYLLYSSAWYTEWRIVGRRNN